MPLVLGVDSSADATRVELRDANNGQLLASGHAPHPPVTPPRAEQEPGVWWQALVEARHDAGGALGVAAVAVAAQVQGLVVLDGEQRVIRPAKLATDTEAAPDARRLVDALGGPEEWTMACGSVPAPRFTIAQLAWLARAEPDAFAEVATVLTPHDWLTYRLGRRFVTDRGNASGTGYWSPRESSWRPELLGLVDDQRDWGACLPRVLAPEEPAGDREGVLIASGSGDHMAAALGLGLRHGDVVVSLGAPGSVFTTRERPTEDVSGRVAGLANATGRFLPLTHTLNARRVMTSVARVLGVDNTRFDQLALGSPPGAAGVTFVPPRAAEVTGEGAAPGTLHGLRDDVLPEHVARGTVEGVACAVLDALDALRDAGVPIGGRLYLIGAAARSHGLQRALADVSQRPVSVPQGDRVATGACVQAVAVLESRTPDEVAESWSLHEAREIEPDGRVDAAEIRHGYEAAHERERTARA